MPEHLKPAASTAAPAPEGKEPAVLAWSLTDLVRHWRLVEADLIKEYGIDLWDPAVRARPWPGIRTAIFSLIDSDTRLRRALTRR